jgi:photosystem II stability/assembly factor-like uncharacterized protein
MLLNRQLVSRTIFTVFSIGLLFALPATGGQDPDPGSEKDFVEDRSTAFDMQRRYPYEQVPLGAMRKARKQFEANWQFGSRPAKRLTAQSAEGLDETLAAAPWTSLGPYNINARTAGRVAGLALHATNPDILYAATASGGIWKTVDGGQSWTPQSDTACSLSMGAIATDPRNRAIVYAGTGEANINHSYYGCGLLRSTDFGRTWTQLGAEIWDTDRGGATIGKIYVDRATAGSSTRTTVFAASSRGLFKSTNSGLSWTLSLEGKVDDIVVSPRNASVLYATVASNGIFKSTDKGQTWTKLTGGLPADNFGRIGVAVARSNSRQLYAAFAFPSRSLTFHNSSGGGFRGIWTSTDAGVTWRQVAANGASGARVMYNIVLEVDPRDSNTVYFGAQSLFKSTDAGENFASISNGIHVDQHALLIDTRTSPVSFYAGNDGGVWKSINGGASWTTLNKGIVNVQFSSRLALHPIDPNNMLGGLQDNGSIESGGDPLWRSVAGSDGGYSAINFLNGTTAFRTDQFGPPARRDSQRGSFVTRATGINVNDRAFFYPPLIMDATNPEVLYFGTFRLYRTGSNAQSWNVRSRDLTKGAGFVTAIAASPSDPNVVYVGTSDGNLWVTTNIAVNPPELPTFALKTEGLPERFVTDITVDPRSSSTAYVAVSGFGTGHVFKTTDAGDSWVDISANLPNVPVNAVAFHAESGTLFIGTDLGAFLLANGSTTWEAMTNGMPNVVVIGLTINTTTKKLVAATWGRGGFSFDLP